MTLAALTTAVAAISRVFCSEGVTMLAIRQRSEMSCCIALTPLGKHVAHIIRVRAQK
jgi:hypothetical protein